MFHYFAENAERRKITRKIEKFYHSEDYDAYDEDGGNVFGKSSA